jgi:hypothetical protein
VAGNATLNLVYAEGQERWARRPAYPRRNNRKYPIFVVLILLCSSSTRTRGQPSNAKRWISFPRSRRILIGMIQQFDVLMKLLGENIKTSCILLRLKKKIRQGGEFLRVTSRHVIT